MILCIILLVILWFHLQYRLWDIENKINHIADHLGINSDDPDTECTCKLCGELFIARVGENCCQRCCHERIIEDE